MKIDELQEIKERYNRAKPGPWIFDAWGLHTRYGPLVDTLQDIVLCSDLEDGFVILPGDKKFIERSVQDIPALLAEVERLQAEAVTVQQVLEQTLKAVEEAEYWKSKADRLQAENARMRVWLSDFSVKIAYSIGGDDEGSIDDLDFETITEDGPCYEGAPWEYAQSKLDELKGEGDD